MQCGWRSFTYCMALSRGKSVEKKESNTSHRGQFSTSIRPMDVRKRKAVRYQGHTFVQNDFVAKDLDLYRPSCSFNQPREYFAHGF